MTSYVLIADAESSRVAGCLAVCEGNGSQAHVARSTAEAVASIGRRGAPALIVADMRLPDAGALPILEALEPDDRARVPIVLWCASRELRELARARTSRLNVRLLDARAGRAVLGAVVDRLLGAHVRSGASHGTQDGGTEDLTPTLKTMLAQAARRVTAAGRAVYLRSAGDLQFRNALEWTADAPMPSTAAWMPHVFDMVVTTGRPLIATDLDTGTPAHTPPAARFDGIRGCVAVPVTAADGHVIGMICLFDAEPLRATDADIDALGALGRSAAVDRSRAAAVEARKSDRKSWAGELRDVSRAALPVSALLDRPGGLAAIQRELARARREGRQLGVIVFDVDPIASSAHIAPRLRASDLAIHWSETELLVVLTGVAAGDARAVAERLHAAIPDAAAERGVAGGVSELRPHDTFEHVLARAHEKMWLVKRSGHSIVA